VARALRLIQILTTAARYRLDLLFKNVDLPFSAKLLFVFFRLFPQPKLNRAERLRKSFEDLGPIFIKFGQLLSTRPDLLPADIVVELNKLQDQVPPFDPKASKTLIETALGEGVEEVFADFEDEPMASASIAQVHAASLKNGREVVVKVVRPGIEQTIRKDIHLLQAIAKLVERYHPEGKRLRPQEVVENYRLTINDELDLIQEAANASQLRRNFKGSPMLYVPEIFWDYTRSNVMVMERVYGSPVTSVEKLKSLNIDFKKLAERGVEIFFTQVFDDNFFHADMHPGNVLVSHDTPQSPSYIALDMAIVGSLSKEDQYYLARNLIAMFRRDYRLVAELHVSSGWVPKTTSVAAFESAIRAVCEPIFQKPLKDISFGEALVTLFRTAQRFDMPVQPQLVLLQKTLINIEGLGRQLYPDLDLWATAHPFLENWLRRRYSPKTLWREFKYHAPEWLEKFPQFPHLVFDSLDKVQSLAEIAPDLQNASKSISGRSKAKNKYLITAIAFAAGLSSYALSPNIVELQRELVALGVAAIAILILR
jgi:ubiquinone biosynthesis protein